MLRALLAAFASCLVVGCSSEGTTGAPRAAAPGATSGPDSGVAPLSFVPCPLVTAPGKAPPSGPLAIAHGYDRKPSPVAEWLALANGIDGLSSAKAECATATMPAVWSDPQGDSIDVFVKRYPAAVQPAKGQVWMLAGGPGQPGAVFETLAFITAAAIPTLDIYMPDHRGTGKSTFASCPQNTSSIECAASVPHLDGLTATDAARDLGALIDASRMKAQQVFVYGFSYGTYWAQRYLQIRPEQPTAVILDSTIPVGMDYADLDKNFDDVAHRVLALCRVDAACSVKLGPDPVAAANRAVSALDAGACKLPPGVSLVRRFLGQTLGVYYFEPMLLPASIYRLLRCNDADRAWLQKVAAYLPWWDALSAGTSDVVFDNITASELLHTNATAAEFWGQEKAMLAVNELPLVLADSLGSWPAYPHDAYYGKWPSSPAPILVLQGTLDPRTPYGDLVKSHYSGKYQYFVEMPRASHVSSLPTASPMADLAAPGCGSQVVQSFLADPTRPPDTSCIAGMAPLDFGHPPAEWLALVGIQDLWENP
jgi:pimeloyl-ACP methyl ester carboxylesterase